MTENLNKCEKKEPESIPYVVHEAAMNRAERHIKRTWIALIVAVALIFLSNMAWLYAWTRYDYESYEVSADGDGIANYIGNDGDIFNHGKGTSEETSAQE